MNENVLNKLKILAESAKYDVSCSSSGTVRSNKPGMLGNTVGGRALHFTTESDADELLHLRLCILHQSSF